ncbi:MAG: lipopolysaccharide biosynthesis protein [Actinomycetia bacterium]|nr:lipopolysaccharide biosynthesis protein [Actinomycetes bacterium]
MAKDRNKGRVRPGNHKQSDRRDYRESWKQSENQRHPEDWGQSQHTGQPDGWRQSQSRASHGRHSAVPTKVPKKPKAPKKPRQHRPNFIARTVNSWFNRLLSAAFKGSADTQEELYAAHRTSRDYVLNGIGIATWGLVFPLLTIVSSQLVGIEQAGMFSMAFVVGTILMFLGNYGVRTYQVSDIHEEHSFSDYQANRWLTCIVMIVVGVLYCLVRSYAPDMLTISIGVYTYKMIDGLADVYEGRLQQMDKLYLAGISQSIRSVSVLAVFSLTLLITHNLVAACIAMAVIAAATFVLITFPLAYLETPRSGKRSMGSIRKLFSQCFPLFVAFFLYALIDSMPKLVMEGSLDYGNQLYFNAIYFPAMIVLLTVGFVYKPQLVRLANLWEDRSRHKFFDLIIAAVAVVIVVLVLVMILLMNWVGIPVMSFLYGVDFEPFRNMFFIMLVAGGMAAAVDFLYQIITVLRKQKAVMGLYLIGFGFSLMVCILLVNFTGLTGAIISYLIVMCILFVLLLMEFIRIRFEFSRQIAEKQREERRQQLSEMIDAKK